MKWLEVEGLRSTVLCEEAYGLGLTQLAEMPVSQFYGADCGISIGPFFGAGQTFVRIPPEIYRSPLGYRRGLPEAL